MKCSWRPCFYSTVRYRNFTYKCGQAKSTAQVAKGLSMGEKWLMNRVRRRVLSSLSFTDKDVILQLDVAEESHGYCGKQDREYKLS